jgi:hypothetical protein
LLREAAIAKMIESYRYVDESLAEGMLQLLILDESLSQLDGLRTDASH